MNRRLFLKGVAAAAVTPLLPACPPQWGPSPLEGVYKVWHWRHDFILRWLAHLDRQMITLITKGAVK